jgi:hypothetical protein
MGCPPTLLRTALYKESFHALMQSRILVSEYLKHMYFGSTHIVLHFRAPN